LIKNITVEEEERKREREEERKRDVLGWLCKSNSKYILLERQIHMKFTPNSENTSQIKCKCRDKEGTKTRQQSQEEDGGED
tara:strand:+ start:392 stop:634 length:243 start_codon:yes stop_codon:yes gene_type:complete